MMFIPVLVECGSTYTDAAGNTGTLYMYPYLQNPDATVTGQVTNMAEFCGFIEMSCWMNCDAATWPNGTVADGNILMMSNVGNFFIWFYCAEQATTYDASFIPSLKTA